MSEEPNLTRIFPVKVPWHARLRGWWNSRRARRNAWKTPRHIATVCQWTYWTDAKHYSQQWYSCYEQKGKRKFEYTSNSPTLKSRGPDSAAFALVVRPWLLGGWTNQQLIDHAQKTHKQPAIPTA